MPLRLAPTLGLCALLIAGARAELPAVLTTTREIRALSPEEAALERPVKLRAVVLVHDPDRRATFVHDGTEGIYLRAHSGGESPDLRPGQLLEIEGVTSPGKFLPDISAGARGLRIAVVGEGPLPEPRRLSAREFAEPANNSNWAEIEAVIEKVALRSGLIEMQARAGALGFLVMRPGKATPEEVPWHLERRRVRLRGVVSTVFNLRRQMTGRLFYLGTVELLDPAPAVSTSSSWPLARVDALYRVDFTALEGVRVRGVVTALQPGIGLHLRGAGGGLWVETARPIAARIGSEVEAAGLPQLAPFKPTLHALEVRVLSDGPPPEPSAIGAREAIEGRLHHDLVRLDAELIAVRQVAGALIFELQDEKIVFSALLAMARPDAALAALRPGSRLRVAGICVAERRNLGLTPQVGERFEIQLRDAADVRVLMHASWWTRDRIAAVIASVAAVALGILAWAVTLRRRVASQARTIREQAERSGQVQERMRIASDLHDDLGARVTRIGMLSALAARDGDTSGNLGAIREASREVVQALDAVVWGVNPENDQTAGLTTYFHHVASELLGAARIAGRFDFAELPPQALAVEVRRELFLAYREALNNAVKHSAATEVGIAIDRIGGFLRVRVSDNGRGFQKNGTAPGRQGIGSMEARMERVGGRLEIATGDTGTTVDFTVPFALPAQTAA